MAMQVTVSQMRNAVVQALEAAFPAILVSGEESGRRPDPPCFVVQLPETKHTQELGRRYRRDQSVAVSYFSPQPTAEEMDDVAEQLMTVLKWIAIGGRPWPGQRMSIHRADNALHFTVAYSLLVWEQVPEAPKMQTLEQEGNMHG